MNLFGWFRKEEELPVQDQKWNKMWDLWVEGQAESPYAEIMEYDSEVNNGGHSQYFFNVANCGDVTAAAQVLSASLPEPLLSNFRRGYEALAAQKDICDDENDELFDQCDDVFYDNEQVLLDMLTEYADTMK